VGNLGWGLRTLAAARDHLQPGALAARPDWRADQHDELVGQLGPAQLGAVRKHMFVSVLLRLLHTSDD
jgi:hypothetical protein